MGAIATGDVRVLNPDVVGGLGISERIVEEVVAQQEQELTRRERLYREDRPPPQIHGRTVILVDDGLATGATMRAGAAALRQLSPRRIVVAVPVAAPETCEEFRSEVDEVICLSTPDPFCAVGFWYHDFSQTTDDEVRALLEQAGSRESVLPRFS
jgi:predicted phosphoribosyltransferase